MNTAIGDKLRVFRLQRRMTLVELSIKSGVSKSLLSRIERGHSVPTITTFQKIATALGANPPSFFGDHETGEFVASPPLELTRNGNGSKGVSVVRKEQRKKLILPWGAHYEMLCPDLQHKIEFIYLHYPVGAKAQEAYSHDGEECGMVLEGRFKAIISDQEYILEPGDSIFYESSIPHRWENAGDVEVKAIWAITPPSF